MSDTRVTFICPACKAKIKSVPSLEGHAADCPSCGADVVEWPAPTDLVPVNAQPTPPTLPPIPMWHYVVNGNRRGPVTDAQLRSMAEGGSLRPTDMVWREGMPDWVPASQLRGLFPASLDPIPPVRGDRDGGPRRRRRNRDEAWGGGAFAAFIFCTILLPIVGIIMGAIDLGSSNKNKRTQGAVLLGVGIFMVLAYIASYENRPTRHQQ